MHGPTVTRSRARMCQTEKNPRLDLPKGCEELLDDDWEKKKKKTKELQAGLASQEMATCMNEWPVLVWDRI